MRKVLVDELLPLHEYEAQRDARRGAIIARKKSRRVLVGPELSLLFENRETVWLQVQEMLRAEKIVEPKAVRYELDTYNELLPRDGCLRATLMIEVPDAGERERRRRDYVGLHEHVWLELGDTRVRGAFDPAGLGDEKISVVQYVTFELGAGGAERLLAARGRVVVRCTHPRYGYATELPSSTIEALAADLSPDESEARTKN